MGVTGSLVNGSDTNFGSPIGVEARRYSETSLGAKV